MTTSRRDVPTGWRANLEWITRSNASDQALARRGRVTAALLLLGILGALIGFTAQFSIAAQMPGELSAGTVAARMLVTLALLAGLFVLNRLGYTVEAGFALAVLVLGANFIFLDPTSAKLPGPAALLVPILIAGLLGPPVSAFAVASIAVIGHLWANINADPAYLSSLGSEALGLLSLYGQFVGIALATWLFSRTSSAALRESATYSQTLSRQQEDLETRVATQSRYLQATTTVARAIVGAQDIDRLLSDTVRLVHETFGYYHVQVFLIDDEREYAILRASTGEAGATLLARGHRLPVGSLSVIGQVTASGRLVIARDTDADAVHRRNELLPLTRSEMALPLSAGGRVIGALDLQSIEPDAFGGDVIPTLQALADQLAIAIENARLYTQTQSSLRELQELYGEVTERSWSEFLASASEADRKQIYGPEPNSLMRQRNTVVKRVLGSNSAIVSSGKDGRPSFLAAPIVIRNEVIGVIGVEPDGMRDWSQDDLQLIQSIAERTALAVENARLYLQAQHSADRERMVNLIAARLQRAPNLALLLESATKELASALGTDNVYAEIRLDRSVAESQSESSGEVPETVEGEARPSEEQPLSPDEPEEARAEL